MTTIGRLVAETVSVATYGDTVWIDGTATSPAKISPRTLSVVIGSIAGGTITDNSVGNAKLSDVPTATLKGRTTAGSGDPEDLTLTQVKTLLSLPTDAVASLAAKVDSTAHAAAASHAIAQVSGLQTALDAKAVAATTVIAGNGLTGGGALTSNVTLSATFAGTGANYGTALTLARSDHKHDVATTSVDGYMSATDKARFDVAVTGPQFILTSYAAPNNTATFTAADAGYYWNLNSGSMRVPHRDTRQVAQIVHEGYVSIAALTAGSQFLLAGSPDNGTTWYWMNGETVNRTGNTINAGPVAGIDAAAVGGTPANVTGAFKKSITLPAVLQAESTIFDVVLTPTTTGTNPQVRFGQVSASIFLVPAGTSLPTVVTELELQDTASNATRLVTPATFETLRRQTLAYAGHVWILGRNVKNLETDFGANNLVADAEPHSAAGTAQDTKLTAIMNSLSGPTDLVMDPGRFFCITKPIVPTVSVDGLRFINKGGPGTSGFINTWTGADVYSRGQVFSFGNQGAGDFVDEHVWRLAAGINGGTDIRAGDTCIRIPLVGDFNAVDVGSIATRRIVIVGPWVYSSNARLKPIERWTADVIEAKQVSGEYRFYLSEPIPFDIHASNNATYGWPYKRSDNTDIQGIAWTLLSNISGPNYYPSNSYQTSEFQLHNLYLENRGQVIIGQLPRNFEFDGCELHSPYGVIYGNSGQCGSIRQCFGSFGANMMEISFVCVDVRIQECRFAWNNDTTYGGGAAGTGNLISFQEVARNCELRDCFVNAAGWNPAEATHKIFRDTGFDNKIHGVYVIAGTTDATCLNVIAEGTSSAPRGGVYKDIRIDMTDPSYNGLSFGINGTDHKLGGIRFNHASASAAQSQINASCANVVLQDVVQNVGTCRVNSGTSNIRFERCSLGTVTDSSGGELVQVAGTADYLRHKSAKYNFGAA